MMGKIHGMDVRELMTPTEEDKSPWGWYVDWEHLPSASFDFVEDLPLIDSRAVVSDDSKVLLAGGFALHPVSESEEESENGVQLRLSYDMYEFEIDTIGNNNKKPLLTPSESIPQAPVPFAFKSSLVANISGDLYILVFNAMVTGGRDVFWVLPCGGQGEWKSLPPPPPLRKESVSFGPDTEWFVLHGKLFLRAQLVGVSEVEYEDDEIVEKAKWLRKEVFPMVFLSFDPENMTWEESADDDSFMNSFGLSDSNYSLVLSCSYLKEAGNYSRAPFLERPGIHALLVNQNGACLYQLIDECFQSMHPAFLSISPFLVDLGDGKICVLLYGPVTEYDSGKTPVLHISVFALAMKDIPDIDAEGWPKKQSFLSVNVLHKCIYGMKGYSDYYYDQNIHSYLEGLQQVFISNPTKKDKEV